jgi:hypothetical protein
MALSILIKIGVRDRANASNLIKKDNLLDYSI